MVAITTRQRDLILKLLETDAPLGTNEVAAQMHLTPRQVNYDLKGIECWLKHRGGTFEATPGLGIKIACSSTECDRLRQDLFLNTHMQLVLSAKQRQQLLALLLVSAEESMILAKLKLMAQVSRSTVSKDLDAIEGWCKQHSLNLIRRPNYGVFLKGSENARQEILYMLLWGKTPFGKPLTSINYLDGLTFLMHQDANLLPLVEHCSEIIGRWDVRRYFGVVAYAETQIGGRFTDDAVLHLALVFAVQADRVAAGHSINMDFDDISWIKSRPIWPIAKKIAQRLGWDKFQRDVDVAGIAMHILASPRNERWPGDLEIDSGFRDLIFDVMVNISESYNIPTMIQDPTLHDGIVNQVVPACLRQRFQLWMPPPPQATTLSEKYKFEKNVAQGIAQIIVKQLGLQLTEGVINNIAMLMRAAYIRTRPYRLEHVIVVCPSGMATAQLLVARLEARFPRLSPLEILSLRELSTKKIEQADLIISTVSLSTYISNDIDVIQVHPLLLPEDVEALTKYLT